MRACWCRPAFGCACLLAPPCIRLCPRRWLKPLHASLRPRAVTKHIFKPLLPVAQPTHLPPDRCSILRCAVTKTATIVPEFLDEEVHIFKPLAALTQAVVKIATEPLNPSELPKMVGFSGTNWFWC